MGVRDLEADGPESYVELALRTANDREFRSDVTSRILASSEVLFENAEAVRQLEDWIESEFRSQEPSR
jgi:hypothetical protein